MRWLAYLTAIIVFGTVATAVEKIPCVVECTANALILRATGERVTWEQLHQPGNRFEKLLDEIQTNQTVQCLALLVRPGSAKLFHHARLIGSGFRKLDVRCDVDETIVTSKSNGLRIEYDESRFVYKPPAIFECRSNQVFFVDKEGLQIQAFHRNSIFLHGKLQGSDNHEKFIRAMEGISNEYYTLLPEYLTVSIIVLAPKSGVNGENPEQFKKSDSRYRQELQKLQQKKQAVLFLVRDDSFPAFRHARSIAEENQFETSWELLGVDETLKFGIYGGCPGY